MDIPVPHSTIGWLDFSEQERRQAIELVKLYGVRETRDELGVGSIRDALAEMLFPGTTTLQTRARYFLFVPWLYREYDRLKVPSSKIEGRLHNDEIRLIRALQDAGETDGVIGRIAGASLHRFPASIYWNGMRRWGILRFEGAQSQHHRVADSLHARGASDLKSDDGGSASGNPRVVWDPKLPQKPERFPEEADFFVTQDEAAYLRDRLDLNCAGSLLAHLARHAGTTQDVSFAWMHPDYAGFPTQLKSRLEHARLFSLAMHGAMLLYNLMLSELKENAEWIEDYRAALNNWQQQIGANQRALEQWDRLDFWRLATRFGNISLAARRFVEAWLLELLPNASGGTVAQIPALRALIRNREARLKAGRSRFTSLKHLEQWSGAAGAARMDFRWRIASRILNDILEGLEEG